MSPDGENFLSADDLRINLWSLENHNVAYQIVDLKPDNIEELAEVMTHVEYHPKRSDTFLFTSSKGYICLCDLRVSSQFKNHATKIRLREDPSRQHFFTDISKAKTELDWQPQFDLVSGLTDSYKNDYLADKKNKTDIDFSLDEQIVSTLS